MKHSHPKSSPRAFAAAPGAAALLAIAAAATLSLPSALADSCCSWDGGNNCGDLCGTDGSTWCHLAESNCLGACSGTHYIDGTPIDNCGGGGGGGTCTMPTGVPDDAADVDNTGFATAHGKLKLDGVQLVDAAGRPVQLMGMSSHGLHWFPSCYTKASIQYQVEHWGINVFRAAMYVGEGGYASDPSVKQKVKDIVQWCKELGIYAMIDWHVLTPGNPNDNVYSGAVAFFEEMATLYKGETHVLYEIANEPNGVGWTAIKSYADNMIAKIRAIDAETIIIVGTPTWSQEIDKPAAVPVAAPHNVMYAFHFYAGSHIGLLGRVQTYAPTIPIFVTEWGTSEASGNNGPYLDNAKSFLDLFNDASGTGIKLSWAQWSYADKSETSAALIPGACGSQNWDDTSCSGTFVKNYIKSNVATAAVSSSTTTAAPATTTAASTTAASTTPATTSAASTMASTGATTTTTDPVTTTSSSTTPATTTSASTTSTTASTTTASSTTPATTTSATTSTTTSTTTASSTTPATTTSAITSTTTSTMTTATTTTAAPITTTDSPTTPASTTTSGGGACVTLYQQCGGMNYNGETTCCAGSVCIRTDDYYSQCRPDTSGGGNCVALYGQCGGINHNDGTTCCAGSACVYNNDYYSQCLPNRMLRGGKL